MDITDIPINTIITINMIILITERVTDMDMTIMIMVMITTNTNTINMTTIIMITITELDATTSTMIMRMNINPMDNILILTTAMNVAMSTREQPMK